MATSTIKTNELNDIFLPDGRNLFILTGSDALEQNIRHATLMRTGEDIYDINNGVDYLGTIFTPQPDYDAARKSIVDAIQKKADVLAVDSLDISIQGDVFNFTAEISTSYGITKVSNQ